MPRAHAHASALVRARAVRVAVVVVVLPAVVRAAVRRVRGVNDPQRPPPGARAMTATLFACRPPWRLVRRNVCRRTWRVIRWIRKIMMSWIRVRELSLHDRERLSGRLPQAAVQNRSVCPRPPRQSQTVAGRQTHATPSRSVRGLGQPWARPHSALRAATQIATTDGGPVPLVAVVRARVRTVVVHVIARIRARTAARPCGNGFV